MKSNLIILPLLALALAGVAMSQTASSNSSVSLYPIFPNLTIHLNIPNYTTPVNPSGLMASTSMRVTGGTGANNTYLQVIGGNSLSLQNVNVVLSVTSGISPFNSVAILGITPATRSGIYNITIAATNGGAQGNTVLHLHVLNPTNVTFLYGNDSNVPSLAQASAEMNMSMASMYPSTTTMPATSTAAQQVLPPQQGAHQVYYYLAAILALIAIAAIAFVLMRRRR
ncbi:MAG TPA: hypothetical protein VND15_01000 [Candidatus Acidoferrales bacterium]|nr:hypothetical protein [Candidatus Acidoferrales bacterium]